MTFTFPYLSLNCIYCCWAKNVLIICLLNHIWYLSKYRIYVLFLAIFVLMTWVIVFLKWQWCGWCISVHFLWLIMYEYCVMGIVSINIFKLWPCCLLVLFREELLHKYRICMCYIRRIWLQCCSPRPLKRAVLTQVSTSYNWSWVSLWV
jgi:hypothetical protein